MPKVKVDQSMRAMVSQAMRLPRFRRDLLAAKWEHRANQHSKQAAEAVRDGNRGLTAQHNAAMSAYYGKLVELLSSGMRERARAPEDMTG